MRLHVDGTLRRMSEGFGEAGSFPVWHTFGARPWPMRCALLLSLLSFAPFLVAQEDAVAPVRTFTPHTAEASMPVDTPVVPLPFQAGKVTITADPGVNTLMGQYAEVKDELKGYRVQIFLGTREQANPLRAAFLQKNPDVPAYLSYLAPNFRVRVAISAIAGKRRSCGWP